MNTKRKDPVRWITSDHHFFHENILKFQKNRNFETLDEMHEAMIQAHNAVVGEDDEVWLLGDFSFGTIEETNSILERMKGRLRLIRGNHDIIFMNIKDFPRLESLDCYDEFYHKDRLVSVFHMPIEDWIGMNRGAYHFHGHRHGSGPVHPGRRMDIGVDTRDNLGPWLLDDAMALTRARANPTTPRTHQLHDSDELPPVVTKASDHAKGYLTGPESKWNYSLPPIGVMGKKMQLLTIGNQNIIGRWYGDECQYFKAWAPLISRDHAAEKAQAERLEKAFAMSKVSHTIFGMPFVIDPSLDADKIEFRTEAVGRWMDAK